MQNVCNCSGSCRWKDIFHVLHIITGIIKYKMCFSTSDVSSASGGSSQPEIVDVPETIVTIHAQTSISPSSVSTASEGSSLGAQIQRRYQKVSQVLVLQS
jgi:hypothetical protein